MAPLELLHRKVRELGGRAVREVLPPMHSNKFNALLANLDEKLPDNVLTKMSELWPNEMNPTPVEEIGGAIGANQLNFTILQPVRNSYDPSTVGSIVGLVRRTGCGWMQLPFDSMIARSRNILTHHFLKSDYEWSLWVDDDMIIPNGAPEWFRSSIGKTERPIPDEFAGLIAPYSLASWDKKIVSAVYYSRHGTPQITAGFHPGTKLMNQLPHRSIIPVGFCGFGCVLVHRQVYEDIIKLHPELYKTGSSECQVFSTFATEGRMAGEDQSFCSRAKEAGHDTFLDLSVVAGHVGRRVNYIPSNLNTN